MFITRQHPKGAPKLSRLNYHIEGDQAGYKIGYCEGCSESLLIKVSDISEILSLMDRTIHRKPRGEIIRLKIIKILGNTINMLE